MDNKEYIKVRLIENKANFREIAYKTNLTEKTLYNIINDHYEKPNTNTVTRLVNYFKRREAAQQKRTEKAKASEWV